MSLTLARFLPRSLTAIQARAFSMSSVRAAEGDTGATRSGGAAQSDAFTKREHASEDYYVREQEKQKLESLRKKIADKEAELAKHREEAEQIMNKK